MIDVFTKYGCLKLSKGKKGKTVLNALIEIVSKTSHKPNKLLVENSRKRILQKTCARIAGQ